MVLLKSLAAKPCSVDKYSEPVKTFIVNHVAGG